MNKTPQNSWNYRYWLSKFNLKFNKRQDYRDLRVEVFMDTMKIVKEGHYFVGGKKVELQNQHHELHQSLLYCQPESVAPNPSNETKTKVSVINADCLEAAKLVAEAGYCPVVLNMANRETPGGGVLGGAGAQEENIFRRSNLFESLYQFSGMVGRSFDIPTHPTDSYPLNRETGGVYSPNIVIFRGSEPNGYCLLKKPYHLSFVTVPAIYSPKLKRESGRLRLHESFVSPTKEKIRTILRIALLNGHDSAILSAFGCGAFRNPPNHMAELFGEVFEEAEFKDKLKWIVFAIIDDHNAWKQHNPEGNVLPFLSVFG